MALHNVVGSPVQCTVGKSQTNKEQPWHCCSNTLDASSQVNRNLKPGVRFEPEAKFDPKDYSFKVSIPATSSHAGILSVEKISKYFSTRG